MINYAMLIVPSTKRSPAAESKNIRALIETITEVQLHNWVERISVPRHFEVEPEQNRATATWLIREFRSMGYAVERQGPFANIVAGPDRADRAMEEVVLIGAHYDSVPTCPGADDNGSAVAALLGCAAACALWRPASPVVFVAFNREEDGLLGSRDFVESFLPTADFRVTCAHILEMVGYANSEPGSQRVPTGLPIKMRDTGDFLGLLANGISTNAMNFALSRAETYVSDLPVIGLNIKLGLEKYFPVLGRSDHAPFWEKKTPAVMWTDTSEFRNPHYHRESDTPDSLDYRFLRRVTQLLAACVIQQAEELLER